MTITFEQNEIVSTHRNCYIRIPVKELREWIKSKTGDKAPDYPKSFILDKGPRNSGGASYLAVSELMDSAIFLTWQEDDHEKRELPKSGEQK